MSRAPRDSMTSTTYAVLGLLCVQPWSAYELAQQMARSLRFMWPRAESGIYREPQSLIGFGYASAGEVPGLRRTKLVYAATPACSAGVPAVAGRALGSPAVRVRSDGEVLLLRSRHAGGRPPGPLEESSRLRARRCWRRSGRATRLPPGRPRTISRTPAHRHLDRALRVRLRHRPRPLGRMGPSSTWTNGPTPAPAPLPREQRSSARTPD